MKSLLLALIALIVATFSLDVGYEEFEDQEVEQGHVDPNEWMRWLATSVLPVPESEIRGLEWLYNATNGNNWLWNTDNITYGIPWSFPTNLSLVNPCYDHWQGILCTCNTSYSLPHNYYNNSYYYNYFYYDDEVVYPSSFDYCHINKIYISGYNLTGSLPDEMFVLLPNLTHLHVRSNSLYSPLPAELQRSGLMLLDISGNYFEESLDLLGGVTTLQCLLASNNYFNGDLSPLEAMKGLTYLRLHGNLLTGSLNSLSRLPNLVFIGLGRNRFTGQLTSIQHHVNAIYILLSDNQLTGGLDALQNLTNLEYLELSNNQLNGTLQALSELVNIQALFLRGNQLTGSLYPLANLTALEALYLYNNQLTGSLYPLRDLKRMLDLQLNDNQLKGSLRPISGVTTLRFLVLYNNALSGSLDPLGGFIDVQILFLSNNQLTGTLAVLTKLSALDHCLLDNNLLVGSIPSLRNLTNLILFTVQYNLLTGPLLPYSFPNSIVAIGVANNGLSGELPLDLFELSQLKILAAGINCMTAHLTDLVCNASSLLTLALDGLHSAKSCRNTMPLRVVDTIYTSSQSMSSIPSCLFSLPNIVKLHLSGNGIEGSLPSDIVLNEGFVDLVLSNNKLTSTIPSVFQNHQWNVFDLSYNKFSGTLLPSLDVTDSAKLKLNRLSGYIPASLHNTRTVSVLTGNIFACNSVQLSRLNDEVQDRYVCGSDSFTNTGLLWFTVVVLALLTIGLSYLSGIGNGNSALERWISRTLTSLQSLRTKFVSHPYLHQWLKVVTVELKLSSTEMEQFLVMCQNIRMMAGSVTSLFVCCHLPIYCIFSSYFGTYTITYAWTASPAYLSGIVPGVILFIMYLGTLLIPCYYYRAQLFSLLVANIDRKEVDSNLQKRGVSMTSVVSPMGVNKDVRSGVDPESADMITKRHVSLTVVSILNLVVVAALNGAYVYTILQYNGTVVTLVDICMGIFKSVWTNVVLVESIRFLEVFYIKSSTNLAVTRHISFLSFMSIMNNIVIPCLSLSVMNPNCFYNLMYARDIVALSYSIQHEVFYYLSTSITTFYTSVDITYDSTLQYTPSYSYSYQCSAAILTTYVVIFLYSAFFGLVSLFCNDQISYGFNALKAWTKAAFGGAKDTTRTSQVSTAPSEEAPCRPPIDSTLFILQLVTSIAVMLSFGCVFPFLAFIVFITIICQTKYAEYRIGRYLEEAMTIQGPQRNDKLKQANALLNNVLYDIQQKLVASLWQIVPLLGLFYGLFVFDIIGDASDSRHARGFLVVLMLASVMVYLVPYIISRYKLEQMIPVGETSSVNPILVHAYHSDKYNGHNGDNRKKKTELTPYKASAALTTVGSPSTNAEDSFSMDMVYKINERTGNNPLRVGSNRV